MPQAPTALDARATSPTSVALNWQFAGTADYFEIDRREAGGYTTIGQSYTTSFTDVTAGADKAYLYAVRAVKTAVSSVRSTSDLATTVIVSPTEITANVTTIQLNHITKLRTAVNAVRGIAGLGALTFSDLSDRFIRKTHIEELRDALDIARANLYAQGEGTPPVTFADRPLVTGALIRATHVNQLIGGVQ
jgi:fibronectin type 3 domain-containing protein